MNEFTETNPEPTTEPTTVMPYLPTTEPTTEPTAPYRSGWDEPTTEPTTVIPAIDMEQATALTYWPRCGHTSAAVCDVCATSVLDAVVSRHDYDMSDVRLEHSVAMANLVVDHNDAMAALRTEHNAAMAALRATHDAWKDELVRDAHEHADRNNMCNEFDRFMEEHGLPTRTRDYSAEVTVTVTVTVHCSGRDDESAEQSIDRYDVRDALDNAYRSGDIGIEDMDYSVVSVEVDD
jgi:hypothetical protein